MTETADIHSTAQQMIETYGDGAFAYATAQVAEFTKLKDVKSAGLWRLIKSLIKRLQAKEAAKASALLT